MANMQQAQRFAVGLTPLPTAARVARARRVLRWRIITTVISLGILAALWWFLGREWSTAWNIAIITFWVLSSTFWLTLAALGLSNAKKHLATISEGVAFYLDPRGIEIVYLNPARIPWTEVTALKLAGRNFGAGPDLVVEGNGQQAARIPLSFLDAAPDVIDSATRAYSLGRVHLDAAALDSTL